MEETLGWLWTLQQIDEEIRRFKREHDTLPGEIRNEQERRALARRSLEQERHHLTELRKQYKLSELDVRACEDKLAALSVQLYEAKTNEAYKAFLNEIDAKKKEKNALEDEMIERLEQIEESERRVKVLEQENADLDRQSEDLIRTLESKGRELEAKLAERERERTSTAAHVKPETLALYERIRRSKGDVAVVAIVEGRCGGCRNPLPAQLILEVEKQDRLHFCEYCGRILYSRR